ncbi:calcitonin gene-related peptide type 1 receptor-like [Argonauta hians]
MHCVMITIAVTSLLVYKSSAYNETDHFSSGNKQVRFCRFKSIHLPFESFKNLSTTMCFGYLFPTIQKRQSCTVLTNEECERWRKCALEAVKCCDEMIKISANDALLANASELYCQANWDGFGCWKRGLSNQTATIKCPSFISKHYIAESVQVSKGCDENGTWNLHPISKTSWTDYSVCFETKHQDLKAIILANIYANAASALFLIPAIIIFLSFKFLRREMTIMIHTSFFISLFLSSLLHLLIHSIFIYTQLDSQKETKSAGDNFECVSLNVLHRYFESATYFWMFCEASHLHQLTVNCFRPPRRMYVYHCFSWGFPLALVTIYTALRANGLHGEVDDDPRVGCWITRGGRLEWIFNVPHFICLLLNILFLSHILRQLINLESHPNDPSILRRSLKALILLLPLFGLQVLIVTYRVPESSKHYLWLNIFNDTIVATKGLAVSVLFCYMNGDVIHHLRKTGLTCLPETRPDTRKDSYSTTHSDIPRGSVVNKSSSVNYKVKPNEACQVLLKSPNKTQQTNTPI